MSDLKKHILLIDDDDRNIFALSAMLKSKGYHCLSCTDARVALDLLSNNTHVDAVLMDMMMPDMDGYEAIPEMRKLPSGAAIPIFAVTAQAMAGDRERCLKAGANDYISKPIDVDRLLHLLTTYLP